MFKNKKNRLITIIVVTIILITSIFLINKDDNTNYKYNSIYDIANYPVSMLDGSTIADVAMENGYLNKDSVVNRYNSEIDALQALRNGKVGSFIDNELYVQEFLEKYDDIMIFPGTVGSIDYAFGFQKGNPLRDEFNNALATIKENGTYQQLYDKWFIQYEDNTSSINQDWVGKNGTLKYWVNIGSPPISFIGANGEVNGFSIDIVLSVCKLMDYNVEITECNFSGIIPAIVSGTCDFGGRSLIVTEERMKQIDFSDSFMSNNIIFVVNKKDVNPDLLDGEDVADNTSIINNIKNSFVSTFISENRYQLFLTGILNTLLITIVSALLGTLLGLIIYYIYYKNNVTVNKIIDTLCNYLAGIPAVVFLMIMYYIVFKKSIFDEMGISVISFSILFAIGVFGLFKAGFNAIGKGQIEAAIDLGFSNKQILSLIVMPQIITYIMPLYRSKLVEHLKATAIVGYIAVLDLTKMSDLVRSRTFEAFFPLIVTAIIYYLLGRLLDFILLKLEDKTKDHKSILLKGVRLK